MSIFIIAEAGVNHNGDLEIAKKLIDAAVLVGANAVKFQTFKAERLTTLKAQTCEYQRKAVGRSVGQQEMLKNLELPEQSFVDLASYCESQSIEFMSTGFDPDSLDFLLSHGLLKRVKVPSGEMGNPFLLLKAARSGLPIILSTGISTIDEVSDSLAVLSYGLLEAKGIPDLQTARKAMSSREGQQALAEFVTVLHCVSDYPAKLEDMNIAAMASLAATFGTRVGLSDHSAGTLAATIACSLGASVIEKHLTLDKEMVGPDHQASLNVEEFIRLVSVLRNTEIALGNGLKEPTAAELKNVISVRGSLVAKKMIQKNEIFTEHNVTVKRPGGGMLPMKFLDLSGKTADRDYAQDELIG